MRRSRKNIAQQANRTKVWITSIAAALAYAGIAYSIYGALTDGKPAEAAASAESQPPSGVVSEN